MSEQSLKPPSLLPAWQGHASLLPQSLVNITHGAAEPHLMLHSNTLENNNWDYTVRKIWSETLP